MGKLILASKSPRRQEILTKMGISFDVCPSECEEIKDESLSLNDMILKLARDKAQDVYNKNPNDVIIGSDTLVVLEGKTMGKPKDEEEAFKMLKSLSGREHQVKTAVYLLGKNIDFGRVSTTNVKFVKLSDDEIINYIKTGEPMDKAGAYAIQERGCVFVEKIEGDFFSVMGLPASCLYSLLKECDMI